MKLFFTIIFLILLSGCSTTKPAVTEYKIALKTLVSSDISSGCRDKSLKVSQAFSSSSLMSLQMNYMQGDKEVYVYTQAQWNNSPNQEISQHVVKVLRDSKIFKNTQSSKSRSKSDLILEVNIEDFMQYYSVDLDSSYSNVMINFTLIDSKNSLVLASKTFSSRVQADTLDASGGVKSLDIALEDVLKQSVVFLNGICR